jgi:branched-subunit amino acid aminotransferase/4-amino-4-deoxychorismate lyase
LLTAPRSHQILPGITRGLVLGLAERAQIEVHEQSFHQRDIESIDELFLTGTSTEVLAIRQVDGKPVGDGAPGPVTRRLAETYRSSVRDWLARSR